MALLPAKFHVSPLRADRSVAKIRQSIGVTASVENVGDISGTFPGSLTLNGQEVDAQPVEVGPGETQAMSFDVTKASAGRARLRLGDAGKSVMVVRPVRLLNGHMLRKAVSGGRAHLAIKNGSGYDAMVVLTRTNSPKNAVLAVYVRRAKTATISGIPDGRYTVWHCVGTDWNTYMRDFLTTQEHKRWKAPGVFSTSSSTNYWTTTSSDARYIYTWSHSQTHVQWSNYTMTLGFGPGKYTVATSSSRFPSL